MAVAYKLPGKAAREALAALSESAPWYARDKLAALLERVDERGIEVRVDAVKPKRTASQNAYYWLCVGILAKSIGMTPDEAHEAVLCEYHGSTEVRIGERVHHVPKGRSHNLPVEAMGELIETLFRVAAFVGVVLPEPEEVE